MEAKVTWNGGLVFTGASDSGFELALAPAHENGGDEEGVAPLELFLIGLAGCTGMDVISILQKKKQKVTCFEVRVRGERAVEHPRVFTRIQVEYVVSGQQLEQEAVERAVELSTTKYCPAHAMLDKAVPIESRVTIIECGDNIPTSANPLGVPLAQIASRAA